MRRDRKARPRDEASTPEPTRAPGGTSDAGATAVSNGRDREGAGGGEGPTGPQSHASWAPSGAGPATGEETLVGTRVGSIRIVGMLARGGMGEVYEGEDEKLGRKVALKALRGELRLQEEAKRRFLQEARVLSQLEHPNICRIYDLVETPGQDFIVLELIHGRDLVEAIREGLTRSERFRIARQIAGALSVAHERGIVHRDLKPGNVILTQEGDVKILDFGISRRVAEAQVVPPEIRGMDGRPSGDQAKDPDQRTTARGEGATQDGVVMGTLGYMSPEQARGEEVSFPSDVFSFGLLLQELFTGEQPYEAGLSTPEILGRATRGESKPAAGLDPDLSALLERMKAPAPGARPSAPDVAERLRWISGKPGRRRARVLSAAAITSLVSLTVAMLVFALKAYREAERANRQAQAAEQVSDFLEGLFAVSDPAEMGGPAVTAREILDRGAERVDRELVGQPLVQARMKIKIGGIYSKLGLYPEAATAFTQALVIRERELGRRDVEVARALDELGNVRWLQGRLQEAVSLLKRSLAVKESILPPDDPEVAKTLNYLALVLTWQPRCSEAEPYLKRALAITEHTYGPDSLKMRALNNNLGSIYALEGRYDEAEVLLQRSAVIARKRLPPGHLDRLPTMDYLGIVRASQGRFAEAEELHRQTLATREKLLGPRHRELSYSLRYLGRTLAWEGRREEAEAVLRRDVDLLRDASGDGHPDTASARVQLAALLDEEGKYREAENLLDPAIPRLQAGVAAEPSNFRWRMALVQGHLQHGIALEGLGKRDQARKAWLQALSLLDPMARESDRLELSATYVETLLLLGRPEEARPAADKVLQMGWPDPLFQRLCREAGFEPPARSRD